MAATSGSPADGHELRSPPNLSTTTENRALAESAGGRVGLELQGKEASFA